MKKSIFFAFLLCQLFFVGCTSEVDNIFGSTSAERVEEAIKADNDVLLSASNGWLLKYYPATGKQYGGYNILLKFTEDGYVTVASDIVGDPSKTATSTYKLKEQGGVTLTFDTLNEIMHIFSDPNNSLGIGSIGLGMEGDYEFSILSATEDKVVLKGKKSMNECLMIPFPEEDTWENYLTEVQQQEMNMPSTKYSYVLEGEEYNVTVSYRTLSITYLNDDDDEVTSTYPFVIVPEGIELDTPIMIEGAEITAFTADPTNKNNLVAIDIDDAKLIMHDPDPSTQFINFGPWFITYDGLGDYTKSLMDDAYAKAFLNEGAPYYGDELQYLAIGDYVIYVDYGFNFITANGKSGILIIEPVAVNSNTVNLTMNGSCDQGGLDFWNNTEIPRIFSSLSGTQYKVEFDDLYHPTQVFMTDKSDSKKTFVMTNQVVPFNYHQ